MSAKISMAIPPPENLRKSLVVPFKTLMGAGPANIAPRIVNSLSHSILGHMHEELFQIMDDIKDGIKYVFQTKNELSLAISASGHAGMEAVMCNLLEPNETVLVAVNGIWGQRASDMAERYGAKVVKMETTPGEAFTLKEIEVNLLKYKPKLLFIVQGETSTGVLQPLAGLGSLCHKYDCLLAVDVVASVSAEEFYMDKWEIDAAYAGSQKALGAPPGLTIISFSPKAQYHHTTCSPLLCSLRESLAMIAEAGLENWQNRHAECSKRLQNGIKELGLEFFVKNENVRLKTVIAVVVKDFDWKELVTYAMRNYKVEIAGGLGPTAGKILRIGVMGYNANPSTIDYVLEVLKQSLNHAKNNKLSKL